MLDFCAPYRASAHVSERPTTIEGTEPWVLVTPLGACCVAIANQRRHGFGHQWQCGLVAVVISPSRCKASQKAMVRMWNPPIIPVPGRTSPSQFRKAVCCLFHAMALFICHSLDRWADPASLNVHDASKNTKHAPIELFFFVFQPGWLRLSRHLTTRGIVV